MSQRVRRAAVGALVVGAVLAGTELALRRVHPVGGFLYRLDPELLFDATPGARTVQRMPARTLGEGDVARHVVTVNDSGFRGPELEESEVRPRVLVLGDSYVMAENVPLGATFVARLGEELGAALGAPVEAVNGGRSGYGPDQSLRLLEREIGRLRPDLVVCVLSAHNDLGDLARNKLYRVGEAGELVRQTPVLGERVRSQLLDRRRRADRPVLARLLSRALARPQRSAGGADRVGAAYVQRYLDALADQADEHFSAGNTEVVSLFEDIYDADVTIAPGSAAVASKAALLSAIVARMGAVAATADAPIRFVVVPSAVDVCPGFGLRVDPAAFPSYRPRAGVDTIAEAVASGGGAVVDLFGTFADPSADAPPERFFVGGLDPHWNARGQALGARVVGAWLAADPDVASALRQ